MKKHINPVQKYLQNYLITHRQLKCFFTHSEAYIIQRIAFAIEIGKKFQGNKRDIDVLPQPLTYTTPAKNAYHAYKLNELSNVNSWTRTKWMLCYLTVKFCTILQWMEGHVLSPTLPGSQLSQPHVTSLCSHSIFIIWAYAFETFLYSLI